IAPNNKIPAIVDQDTGISLFESGAIMIYLADKTGEFLPRDGEARMRCIEWLMWQMAGFGPMLGQVHHFVKFNKGKAPYAEERFTNEAKRLYGVLDTQLGKSGHVAGDYSIADMAIWPWCSRFEWQGIDLNDFANVKRWYEELADRPAVEKGYHVPVQQAAGIPRP
ncbi:MAG: glutathione binding-like protein, partial [Pseudomonadota bacterium]